MEDFDELDDLEFGGRHRVYDPGEANGFEDLDCEDFSELRGFGDEIEDSYVEEDLDVRDSLDLERAYRALAEHRPDLLHPSVFSDPMTAVAPQDLTQSAAGMALRVMDAREEILSSVAEYGSEARSAALSVLAGTPPEALLNPISIELISNFAIGEAVKRGRMGSVSGPAGASVGVSPGASSFGGMSAFESIFGNSRFSETERAELRSAGL